MSSEYPTIVTASLAKQITESLRQMILDGQIKINERLPTEDELAARFGVSRPTIREALKRLAAENLIQSRRGPSGGNFVKLPSPQDVSGSLANAMRLLAGLGEFTHKDIVGARLELESMCCRLATKWRRAGHLDAMRRELKQQRDPSLTDVEFCASDVRFHQALVEATQNSVLRFMLIAIDDALQPITNLLVFRFRERSVIADQHERILTALENRDAEAAIAGLRDQAAYLTKVYAAARRWKREHQSRKHSSVA